MTTAIDFHFLYIEDCGPCDDGHCAAVCPHCGSEGRYIYHWTEDGQERAAMAGCYKALTGHLRKGEYEHYMELLSEKQAKNKTLNSWDRSIIRLLDFKKTGRYPEMWCDQKINEQLSERKKFLAKRHY